MHRQSFTHLLVLCHSAIAAVLAANAVVAAYVLMAWREDDGDEGDDAGGKDFTLRPPAEEPHSKAD